MTIKMAQRIKTYRDENKLIYGIIAILFSGGLIYSIVILQNSTLNDTIRNSFTLLILIVGVPFIGISALLILEFFFKYYKIIIGITEESPTNDEVGIVTIKDVAAIILITITIFLVLVSFNLFKIANYDDKVQEQLIAILGLIGGTYAAAKNQPDRNTFGTYPFVVRGLVSILAIASIIFGSFVQLRPVYLEIIGIVLGRSIDTTGRPDMSNVKKGTTS